MLEGGTQSKTCRPQLVSTTPLGFTESPLHSEKRSPDLTCRVVTWTGTHTSPHHNSQQQLPSFYNNTVKTTPLPPCTQAPGLTPPVRPLPPGTRYVFVRKGGVKQLLAQLYEGPYKVICMSGAVVTIQLGSRVEQIAAKRCKAAVVDKSTAKAMDPPCRGRPRKSPAAT